ncbi:hypothetical protein VW29_00155, partial [Devosia limi DSM 17137]
MLGEVDWRVAKRQWGRGKEIGQFMSAGLQSLVTVPQLWAIDGGDEADAGGDGEMEGDREFMVSAEGCIELEKMGEEIGREDGAGERMVVERNGVNNETGVVKNMGRSNAMGGQTRHTLFIDEVQAFGKLALDLAGSAEDMMAV